VAYQTVAKTHTRTEEVKGSEFIAFVTTLATLEDIDVYVRQVRQAHPDASHHCFAYKLGNSVRFSDDGEPGGTAGRPMLEVLTKRNLDHVLAIVTRYFGGTKLGAGGLVRAYSGSLAKALDEAGVVLIRDRVSFTITVPFAESSTVHRFLEGFNGLVKENLEYSEIGMVLRLSLFLDDVVRFKDTLRELTRGKATYSDL
jgi:uncharacterized YigZ family protein